MIKKLESDAATLLAAFVVGLVFDILFYNQIPGLNMLLFTLVFYTVLLLRGREIITIKLKMVKSWLPGIIILALSLTYLLYSNWIFRILNALLLIVLVVAHTVIITDSARYPWYFPLFIFDIAFSFIYRIFAFIFKPFSIIGRVLSRRSQGGPVPVAIKVLGGVALSVPLLIAAVGLLSSADLVFRHFTAMIPKFLASLKIDNIFGHLILILVVTMMAFSYFASLIYQKKLPASFDSLKSLNYRFVDPVTGITLLTILNITYLFFTLIQFSYLFGGLRLLLPDNYTFAEYARRGFFELVAVTLLNLFVFICGITLLKQTSGTLAVALRISHAMLLVFTMVMVFSAFFRMYLYEQAYGYTYLRVLTHSFMIFIFLILCVSLVKLWLPRIRLVTWYVAISLICWMVLNYAGIDSFIASRNIDRYRETRQAEKIDTAYLENLSYDALPLMFEKTSDIASDPPIAKLRAALRRKAGQLGAGRDWQSFNISEYKVVKDGLACKP